MPRHLILVARISLIVFALAGPGFSSAQFSFSPSKTYTCNARFEGTDYDGIIIRNEAAHELNLNWEVVSVDTIAGCGFAICASGECAIGLPPTGTFPPIAVGDTGWLYMHFWAGNVVGTNSTKIFVYEPTDPRNSDTLTFILNVFGPDLGIENSLSFPVSFYPNPVSDYIKIDATQNGKYSVTIYNSIGQRLTHSTHTGDALVSLDNLIPGYYILIFEDEKGNLKKEKLLKIRQE